MLGIELPYYTKLPRHCYDHQSPYLQTPTVVGRR